MATILLLSGPNLNLLGDRETAIYGTATLEECVEMARTQALSQGNELEHFQSNHEGDLVEAVHGARNRCIAIVINAGALTHSSFALADALAAYDGVKVELHLSNPYVTGTVAGFGPAGYRLAVEAVLECTDKK